MRPVMHAWVFRHLDQLRPIYDSERGGNAGPYGAPSGPLGAMTPDPRGVVQLAPGTAQRLPEVKDVTVAPMPRVHPSNKGLNPRRNR